MFSYIFLSAFLGPFLYHQFISPFSNPIYYVLTAFTALTFELAAYGYYCIILWPEYLSPLRHLPSPDQGPWQKRLLKEPYAGQHAKWINEIPNDGLIRFHGLFNTERLLVTRPEGLKDVLQLQTYLYSRTALPLKGLRRLMGGGILATDFDVHRNQRKLLQPIFKAKNIKELYPLFWHETAHFLKALEKAIPQKSVPPGGNEAKIDMTGWCSRATLDVITLAAFGGSFHAVDDSYSEVLLDYRAIMKQDPPRALYWNLSLLFPYWLWVRLPVKGRYLMDDTLRKTRKHAWTFIEPRKNNRDKESSAGIDVLARLLDTPEPLTKEQLLDHAMTFLFAGHDTTSGAVLFTMYMLSLCPDIQTRLRSEVRAAFPSPDSEKPIDAELIGSLTYLTAVINESLRILAPIPHIRRTARKRGVQIGGVPLPIGTEVYLSPWALNRSKYTWGEDALEYKPERWFKEDGKIDGTGGTGNGYAVNTFGHGPRACIGERFARGEVAVMVAQLVGRFDWSYSKPGVTRDQFDSEQDWEFGITSKPQGGLWLNIKKLDDGW